MQVVGIVEQDEQARLQGSGQAGQWKDRRETRMDTERVEVGTVVDSDRVPYAVYTPYTPVLPGYKSLRCFGGFAIRVSKGQL